MHTIGRRRIHAKNLLWQALTIIPLKHLTTYYKHYPSKNVWSQLILNYVLNLSVCNLSSEMRVRARKNHVFSFLRDKICLTKCSRCSSCWHKWYVAIGFLIVSDLETEKHVSFLNLFSLIILTNCRLPVWCLWDFEHYNRSLLLFFYVNLFIHLANNTIKYVTCIVLL